MSQFALDMQKWIDKTKLRADTVVSKVLLDISTSIVLATPVDTGRARANWQFGVDVIPDGVIDSADAGKLRGDLRTSSGIVGSSSLVKLTQQIVQVKAGHIHYLVNNLPYINMLEYGGYGRYGNPERATGKTTPTGYSTQAPNGMVRITVVRYIEFVNKALAEMH